MVEKILAMFSANYAISPIFASFFDRRNGNFDLQNRLRGDDHQTRNTLTRTTKQTAPKAHQSASRGISFLALKPSPWLPNLHENASAGFSSIRNY